MSKYPRSEEEAEQVIEAAGKCIVPGLVDAHTHPVWVGDRVHEFAMKVKFYHFDQVNLYHLVRIFLLLCTFLTTCSFRDPGEYNTITCTCKYLLFFKRFYGIINKFHF